MVFYISIITSLVILSFLDLITIQPRIKKLLIIIVAFVLILLSGIRWETGTDWSSYLAFFSNNNSVSEFIFGEFELGYGLLNYVAKIITDSYSLLLLMIASIVILIKTQFILSYSPYPFTSFLVNFSSSIGEMFIVRQYIAVALTMLSIKYIIRKDVIKYLACLLLAASFHSSAFVFLPAYMIFSATGGRCKLAGFILVSMLIGKMNIFPSLLQPILSLIGSENVLAVQKLSTYLEKDAINENLDNDVMVVLGYIRRIIFLPLLIMYVNKLQIKVPYYKGLLNLVVFGHCIYFLFIDTVSVIAIRSSAYYIVYEIILIPCFLVLLKRPPYKILLWMTLILYCLLKYSYSLSGYYDLYVPYITVFDDVGVR